MRLAAELAALVLTATAPAPAPPELQPRVDEALAGDYQGGAFFPTGRIVWATHPDGFGFPDDVHVYHHQGGKAMPVVLRWNGKEVAPRSGRALASRVEQRAGVPGLEVSEAKLLTADDVLVAVLDLQASEPGEVEVTASSPWAGTAGSPGAREGERTGSETFHGQRLSLVLAGPAMKGGGLGVKRPLADGERLHLVFALAFAPDMETARAAARRVVGDPDPVNTQATATEAWFRDMAPGFDCPDPWFRTAFLYRLQVVKKAILDARAGNLRHPAALEGRWAVKWYPAAITFGAGHQLAEMRWLRDPAFAWGHLENFVANQRPDGAFVGARVDELLTEYTDFIGLGADDLFLATGDARRFAAAGKALGRNVDYVLTRRDRDQDLLPEPSDHWQSGMEWQPSFFSFSDYDPRTETRLERVEYACYLHAGALAAARALELAGGDGAKYRETARRVAAAIEQRMWNPESTFYQALRASDHARARDREVVGFYPAAFGITPVEHLSYLKALDDPERWKSAFPVPSVEMASPAFDAYKKWPKGEGGSASMWNGPTWPHAQSFVLKALARAERARAVPPGATYRLLESYTRAQFFGLGTDRHLDRPYVSEMYQPFNGVWLSNERDYFHSTYIDLVITLLAGIVPAEGDVLELEPLLPPSTWDHFALTHVPYHGHEIAVVWDTPGGEDSYGDGIAGLTLWVDGQVAARRDDLGPLKVTLGVPLTPPAARSAAPPTRATPRSR